MCSGGSPLSVTGGASLEGEGFFSSTCPLEAPSIIESLISTSERLLSIIERYFPEAKRSRKWDLPDPKNNFSIG